MKSKRITALLVLVMIVGFGILFYPAISNIMREHQKDEILTEYQQSVTRQSDKRMEEEKQKAREYNQRLLNQVVLTDPFDEKGTAQLDQEYEHILNVNEDGIMGYVEIPRIHIYEPIYHGTREEVLTRGTGHLLHTSLPVGGESTHAVISGHTGLQDAEIFTNLTEVKKEDIFYLHILDETLAYQVETISVVEPDDVSQLYIVPGEDLVTLVTCTPYGINSHRLLVQGKRIPYTEETQKQAQQQKDDGMEHTNWRTTYLQSVGKGIGLAILLFGLYKIIGKIIGKS